MNEMIVLIEPVCSSWVHEEVNAGLLKLVSDNSEKDIVFVGEENHIHCIRKIFHDPRIRFAKIKKTIDMTVSDVYANTLYYFRLFIKVFATLKPDKLFILCSYRPGILAAVMLSFFMSKTKIYVVLHGMIEKSKGHQESYAKLFGFSQYCKNVRFITYSPYCRGSYWNVKDDKFIFLNHPYIENCHGIPWQPETNKEKKTVIGVIGACANEKARTLISMVNQAKPQGDYEFWVASKFGKKFQYLRNVKVLDVDFDRVPMEKLLSLMDYMILAYGKQEYVLSASGVLWDAVSSRIPCFMLDSKYLKYYMPYKIGYQAENIGELCNIICKRIQCETEGKENFFENLDQLGSENNRMIRMLL